ncbi:hypothetical protein [Paraburkholderia tagetis]|uniref:Uncharacterized protein n=1 Tax=Paraburkholderia tagetis TaxID=2913261 RepID=A0A9X1RNS0_9BURK|nr:hypothetical protein [Paraburkholderia tagetis]MCG5075706.1 hypothetical protein [Paraburkholderia tagetis]
MAEVPPRVNGASIQVRVSTIHARACDVGRLRVNGSYLTERYLLASVRQRTQARCTEVLPTLRRCIAAEPQIAPKTA